MVLITPVRLDVVGDRERAAIFSSGPKAEMNLIDR